MTIPSQHPEVGPLDEAEWRERIARLKELADQAATPAEAREIASRIAEISRAYRIQHGVGLPRDPARQAAQIDPSYQMRPHIDYLATSLAAAVRKMERGQNQHLAISMPPRSGKSTLTSLYTPLWLLRRHPEWKIVMTSHDPNLAVGWARDIRTLVEDRPDLGVALRRDGGAGGHYTTVEGGGMYATGIGSALVGRGARVLIIDDPVSDFVAAHSPRIRQNLWDWWLGVAATRLEPPYLVLVTMTRWHEDDFVGRLLSPEWEGNPRDWKRITLPALADGRPDPLGREEGQPLYTPLLEETEDQAVRRWHDVHAQVGSYVFASQYQQRPAPQRGAIFDSGWWRFWTTNPERATADGRVVFLDPARLISGLWLDSWDCAFKGSESSGSYVVGQRWVRHHADRYLVAQHRARLSFTQTVAVMERWATADGPVPCSHLVHKRLIEDKANGPAIIDTLRTKIAGLKPVQASTGKEARARAITPEIESGNVYLPHPADPGNEWVSELLSELRNFPNDAHDDQTDALTQALWELRDAGRGGITVPGQYGGWRRDPNLGSNVIRMFPRDIAAAARSDLAKHRLR